MRDIMMDIETFGTDSNSAIVSVSLVAFDLTTGEIGDKLEVGLNLKEQLANGAVMDADTVMWWLSQSSDAQYQLTRIFAHPVDVGLKLISDMLYPSHRLWGNGAGFDNIIVRNLFKRQGAEFPVPFWQDRDVRTLTDLGRVDSRVPKFVGTKHNGIDDCVHQIKYCTTAYKQIRS